MKKLNCLMVDTNVDELERNIGSTAVNTIVSEGNAKNAVELRYV
eukprot:CAMPEP_0185748576 /NCGR_PEP_ID=MMETSP1174-20130828/7287_1 /TAXON_ID=35687 /ORGANISM="Dictyocha speculum, Strain CCMP1381" /LENGTH=43 /DNA_ID= /DNA_START= /DNA_END= /DNA_ORIENTATION=